jgi:hypothetical protein
MEVYTYCCCSRLALRQVEATAAGMATSCRTKCRDEVSCAGWTLARSDGAGFRQMTKIAEAAMGVCHEPDLPAPDAVPNAVPQVLPLLRHGPEGSTWVPGRKGRHPSGKRCRSDKRSNRRCCDRQTQTGGNGSAYARASATVTRAVPQCMNRRYRVTLGVLQLAVDTGGRPHKC